MTAGCGAVRRLFQAAGITLDGDQPGDVRVLDDRFYGVLLRQGSLGLGESYLRHYWAADDLEEVVYRLVRAGYDRAARVLPARLLAVLVSVVANQQTPEKSTHVAERHYNLGNDLFFAMLGRYRNYSSGYFDGSESLDQAQIRKMDLICRRLELGESDHLLDVGGGWGHIAHHAATHYGCRVTSINIADEQIRYARDLCRGLPVEVRKCDYRELTGRYTKIAVIAMLTHVGPKNYRPFMQVMHRCVADDGRLLVESIGSRFANTTGEPWIRKYIFPGGVIPSLRQLDGAIAGRFTRTDLAEFGRHYVPTLRSWHANLMAAWPALSDRYSETSRRMMEYYLLTSAAAFRAERLKYWHLSLSKR